jgi:hypothetical protein
LDQDSVDNCDADTDDTSHCKGPIVRVHDHHAKPLYLELSRDLRNVPTLKTRTGELVI